MAETVNGVENSPTPRKWDERTRVSIRNIDDEVLVADVHFPEAQSRIWICRDAPIVGVEDLLICHEREIDIKRADGAHKFHEVLTAVRSDRTIDV